MCNNVEQLHKPCTTDEVLEELCVLKSEILKYLPTQKDSFLMNGNISPRGKTSFVPVLKDITVVSNVPGNSDINIPMKWVPLMQVRTFSLFSVVVVLIARQILGRTNFVRARRDF